MKGVKFGIYHSFDFFNLILNSKEIGSPEIKKNLIEIAGADGYLDATYFFGEPKYTNRTLTFHFTINPSIGAGNTSRNALSVYSISLIICVGGSPNSYIHGHLPQCHTVYVCC